MALVLPVADKNGNLLVAEVGSNPAVIPVPVAPTSAPHLPWHPVKIHYQQVLLRTMNS